MPKRRKYSAEFKHGTVNLARSRPDSTSQLARELGINMKIKIKKLLLIIERE